VVAGDPADQDWDIETVAPLDTIQHSLLISLLAEILDVSVICSTAFRADGTCLAIGSDKTLRTYNIEKDRFLFHHSLEDGEDTLTNHIRSIAWGSDSNTFLCGGEDGKLRVFSVVNKSVQRTLRVGDGEVFQVAISNDNSYFAAASGDGVVSLLGPGDFAVIERLERDTDAALVAMSVVISPDDRTIAVGYGDWYVGLWDFGTRWLLCERRYHTQGVYAVKFMQHSQRLTTGRDSQDMGHHWSDSEQPTLELVNSLDGHSSYVLTLAIDPTGDLILSGSKDLTAKISSISAGAMLYKVRGHSNSIITVAYIPNGTIFCIGPGNHSVKVWSVTLEEADDVQ
jgi:WD40 repeat protein